MVAEVPEVCAQPSGCSTALYPGNNALQETGRLDTNASAVSAVDTIRVGGNACFLHCLLDKICRSNLSSLLCNLGRASMHCALRRNTHQLQTVITVLDTQSLGSTVITADIELPMISTQNPSRDDVKGDRAERR